MGEVSYKVLLANFLKLKSSTSYVDNESTKIFWKSHSSVYKNQNILAGKMESHKLLPRRNKTGHVEHKSKNHVILLKAQKQLFS